MTSLLVSDEPYASEELAGGEVVLGYLFFSDVAECCYDSEGRPVVKGGGADRQPGPLPAGANDTQPRLATALARRASDLGRELVRWKRVALEIYQNHMLGSYLPQAEIVRLHMQMRPAGLPCRYMPQRHVVMTGGSQDPTGLGQTHGQIRVDCRHVS